MDGRRLWHYNIAEPSAVSTKCCTCQCGGGWGLQRATCTNSRSLSKWEEGLKGLRGVKRLVRWVRGTRGPGEEGATTTYECIRTSLLRRAVLSCSQRKTAHKSASLCTLTL